MLRLVFFARVREAVGYDAQDVALPEGVRTIADCLSWLSAQGDQYAAAFADIDRLRFAIDQQMAKPGASLSGAKELAIFPPVTGG
jgi:sulfur-carrier protein